MKKTPDRITKARTESGYTLLQMAMALIVIGILFGSLANLYAQYLKEQKVNKTIENVDAATSALDNFQKRHGKIPCPAPIDANRNSAAYGSETNCAAIIAGGLAPGQCAGGICIEQTVRTDLTGTEQLSVAGTLPFRTLQLDEDKTFDGYDSRLLYVATFSATNETTYNLKKGAISVRDSNNVSLTPIDGSALYFVLSHGEDAIGAYSKFGSLKSACSGTSQEIENCNIGFQTGTAVSTQSIYKNMLHNSAAGAAYFDDYAAYYSKSSDPTWRRTTANLDNIQDLSPNFIGAGTSSPNQALTISSGGGTDSLRVYGGNGTDGKIKVNEVCDENGNNCFDPLVIAGDNTAGEGMKCATPGEYMLGIIDNNPDCGPITVTCPNSTPVLQSVDAVGNFTCVAIPVVNCTPGNVTVCSGHANQKVFSLPAGTTGSTFTAPSTAGDCRLAKFTCNGTAWVESGSTGYCSPTVGAPYQQSCGSILNPANPWSWTGNATVTAVTSCSGTTYKYDISACQCNSTTHNGTLTCPAPFAGTYPATAKSECHGDPTDGIAPEPSPTPQIFTAPTYVPTVSKLVPAITPLTGNASVCSCSTSDGWEFQSCTSGFKRQSPASPPSFTSPAASWPASTSKGQYRKRTVDAATCVSSYTPWDSSNCVCDTTPSYTKSVTSCDGSVAGDAACEQPSTAPHTIPTVPLTHKAGDDVFQTVRDPMNSCLASTTQIYTGVCVVKPFSWISTGSAGTYTGSGPGNTVGGSCNCSDYKSGSDQPCRIPGDASKTLYFCKCQ